MCIRINGALVESFAAILDRDFGVGKVEDGSTTIGNNADGTTGIVEGSRHPSNLTTV